MSNILKTKDLLLRVGLSRTSIWRLEREGLFPKRIRLSANTVGWLEDEVQDWLASRPRGMATGGKA